MSRTLGRSFDHRWQLRDVLTMLSGIWKAREKSPLTRDYNQKPGAMYAYLLRHFRREDQ